MGIQLYHWCPAGRREMEGNGNESSGYCLVFRWWGVPCAGSMRMCIKPTDGRGVHEAPLVVLLGQGQLSLAVGKLQPGAKLA